jgi:hypothetical protein
MSKQSKGKNKAKKAQKCANCKQKGHTKEQCWAKGGGSEGQGPKQHQKKDSQKKKGKEKAHTVEESGSSLGDDNNVAFMNSETTFISKNGSEITHILDTGASAHMTPHKNLLKNYHVFKMPKCISAANKGIFNALGVSTMILPEQINGKNKIIVKYMLYAPDIAFTLISIGKCDNAGYKMTFVGQKCIIKNKNSMILLQAPKYCGLYQVDHQPTQFTMNLCLDPFDMHKQLGHISQKSMKVLFDQGLILGLELKTSKDKIVCDACIISKITCKPLTKESRE